MELNTIIYLSVSVVLVIAVSFLLMSYFISRSRNRTDLQEYSENSTNTDVSRDYHDLLTGKKFINADGKDEHETNDKSDSRQVKNLQSSIDEKKTSFNTERMTRINSLTKRK